MDSEESYVCCDKRLCGADDCGGRHVAKKLSCGHDGCNFHGSDCLSCKSEKDAKVEKDAALTDIETIKSIMGKIKSEIVKAALGGIVGDPYGKKRKRDDERVDELEFSLKRARNACGACRCGRASYY